MNVDVNPQAHYLKYLILMAGIQIMAIACLWPSHAAEIDKVRENGNRVRYCINSSQPASTALKHCIDVEEDNLETLLEKLHLITKIEFDIPAILKSDPVPRTITAQSWTEIVQSLLKSYNTIELKNKNGIIQRIIVLEKGEAQVTDSTMISVPTAVLLPPPPPPPLALKPD